MNTQASMAARLIKQKHPGRPDIHAALDELVAMLDTVTLTSQAMPSRTASEESGTAAWDLPPWDVDELPI